MIIIKVEKIEDFISFLNRRIGNEIFYEFADSTEPYGTRAILCYLAKVDGLTLVYQSELNFPGIRDVNAIKEKLNKFEFGDIRLISGKIREIIMSIS
ncbi:MAG: hypothetical protein ACTSRS_13745 [Candidatus Helarchaeota archaeon]